LFRGTRVVHLMNVLYAHRRLRTAVLLHGYSTR